MAILDLGKRITLARKSAGITQKDLAAWLNIDAVTLNRYEKGHRIPDAFLIGQLVNFLKCDAEWLLFGFEPTHAKPNAVVPRKRHIESYTPEQREYIEKVVKIFEHATPTDTAYMKGVIDTLDNKAKEQERSKKGA